MKKYNSPSITMLLFGDELMNIIVASNEKGEKQGGMNGLWSDGRIVSD